MNEVEDCWGSSAWALARPGWQVRGLHRVSACFSTTTSTLGDSKMSAAVHGGSEDVGDEVEDCGGRSARELGRASAAGKGEPGGLFSARRWGPRHCQGGRLGGCRV